MRKLVMLAALSGLLLSGCATTPGGGTTVTLPTITLPSISPSVDATIAQVQAITIAQVQAIATSICKFEPAAATVASIIASLAGAGPIVDTASSIASSICASVTKTGVRRGGAAPRVYGVAIHGHFVR